MSGAPQKVQVVALGRPRPDVEKAQRHYYVKWRVDGRDRTRSFKTRVEADRPSGNLRHWRITGIPQTVCDLYSRRVPERNPDASIDT